MEYDADHHSSSLSRVQLHALWIRRRELRVVAELNESRPGNIGIHMLLAVTST